MTHTQIIPCPVSFFLHVLPLIFSLYKNAFAFSLFVLCQRNLRRNNDKLRYINDTLRYINDKFILFEIYFCFFYLRHWFFLFYSQC